jgi:hypothetical protein
MKNFVLILIVLGLGGVIGWFASEYSTRQNSRPCVFEEQRILQEHDFTRDGGVSDDVVRRADIIRMYAELAEKGCPERQTEYLQKYKEGMEYLQARGLFMVRGPREISAEVRVDVEKVGQAVEAAAAAVQPAVDAMVGAFERIKDTRVSITVE